MSVLSEHIDIHLYLLVPSAEYWLDSSSEKLEARRLREWIESVGSEDAYLAPVSHPVIGALGQNGSKEAAGTTLIVRDAQLSMNEVPEFKGSVKAFRTDVLVDKEAEKLIVNWKDHVEEWKKVGSDRAYHYYGSGIWFSRIGNGFGEAMLGLMEE